MSLTTPPRDDSGPAPEEQERYQLALDELHAMRRELASGRAPEDVVPDEDGGGEAGR